MYREPVLIETYWNVKSGADPLTVNSLRINRNILECKAYINSYAPGCDMGINRNILECKDCQSPVIQSVESLY